jgi:ABC-type lipoprotein export system ATPase subunit
LRLFGDVLNHLGYVFQEYAISPELTAVENVYIVISTHEDWHKKYVDRVIYMKDGLVEKGD